MAFNENTRVAQDVHHKFEFYFVALAFTIVGFSLQTGKFYGNYVTDIAETASWITIGCAGLIGILRIQYFAVMYSVRDTIDTQRIWIKNAEANRLDVATNKAQVKALEEEIEKISSKNRKRYVLQFRFFFLGIFFLCIARFVAQFNAFYKIVPLW